MKFNLKDLNPGTWFDLGGGAKIKLKVLSSDDLRDIDKQTRKVKTEYKRPSKGAPFQRFEITNEDAEARERLVWIKSIVDWKGFEDEQGKPIKCTDAMKVKLMSEGVELPGIVAHCFDKLMQDEGDEALEKN